MAKTATPATPAALPEITSIALDDLPAPTKSSAPATIALGNAIIMATHAAPADGEGDSVVGATGAVIGTLFDDRKAAEQYSTAAKRAVRAAAGAGADVAGLVPASRVIATGDKFRVAILLVQPKPAKASANGRGTDLAD